MRILVLALALLIAASAAHGADAVPASRPLEMSGNGPSESPVELARNLIEVTAAKEQSKVTLRLSHDVSGPPGDTDFPKGTDKLSTFAAWSLTLQAPLNKTEEDTELANLNGLADAFTATVKYNRILLKRRNPKDEPIDRLCDELDQAAKRAQPPSSDVLCDAANIEKFLGDSGYLRWHDLYFPRQHWAWGASATVGTQNYEFIETGTTTRDDTRRTPWSLEVFAAVERYRVGLFTLGFRYEDAYKAQRSQTICPLPGTDPVMVCETGPVGEPAKKEQSVAYIEFRRQVIKLAVSPRASYDFESDVLGVELPVYLWRDTKGAFTGGIKAGWRDDTNDFDLGVFVGSAFD